MGKWLDFLLDDDGLVAETLRDCLMKTWKMNMLSQKSLVTTI